MDENKFILDSNIWISYIITDNLDELIRAVVQRDLQIYGDQYLLDEIERVLSRKKFRKYLRAPVSRFIEVIELAVIMTKTTKTPSTLPDPKDNFLVAVAVASGTHQIVTGDKKLLELRRFKNIEFLSLAHFRGLLHE